jgi:very-short-patch-repair endonuclease
MPNTYSPVLVDRARTLRREMPPAERKLWFEGLRLLPQRFRRQRPFGPYIVDFYCAAAKLVIELDGESHDSPDAQRLDEQRDAYLRGLGLRILRFTNSQAMKELDGVMAAIAEAARTPPSPSVTPPLPGRGGKAVAGPPQRAGEGVWRSTGGKASGKAKHAKPPEG